MNAIPRWVVLILSGLMPTAVVHAEVKQSAADGFLVAFSAPVSATPAKVYADVAQPQHWWDNEHTWSGQASNLSLKPEAGGCFCERWKDGSVEHGHVIMALPGKLLRIDAALGPLQEFALKGILNFWIKTDDEGATQLSVEYRVNGSGSSGLDTFAPKVDAVLGAQFARLVRYIDSGNPELPAAAVSPSASKTAADARAALLAEWAAQAAAKKSADAAKAKAAPKTGKPGGP